MGRSSDEAIVDALQRLTGRVTAAGRAHPLATDIATAVLLGAISLVGLAFQGRLHNADTVAFAVLLPAGLALRTVDRRLSFTAVALVALVQWLTSTPQIADAAVLVALFWITLDGTIRAMAAAALVVEAGAVMAALHWSPDDWPKVWVGVTGLGIAAGALGLAIRERRALVVSAAERAARLEFERDQEGRLGAAAERARIAREMHDIVSHNLTVMIGLADGAAYALQSSPDAAQTALGRLSGTGRQALEEMRRLLGVLHEEPAPPAQAGGAYEPQPGLDRLDDLLARVEAAGVPVSIELRGDPHELSPGVQLTVFRVAQEALTNTLKHAGRPASAQLALHCDGRGVTLEVTDSGGVGQARGRDGLPETERLPSGGRGLRGMRERAAAYGGELEAGPRPEGGWRVRLTLATDAKTPVTTR
jgi:signal transduction histidine kinase